MPWLCIASDYQQINVAICNKSKIIDQQAIDKKHGNQQLLTTIDNLIDAQSISLQDLEFIGVNLGPGPYTSLRIVMATVNGLSMATSIPLVGIDALQAFLSNCSPQDESHVTIALLNAFNFDVFYAIKEHATPPVIGYNNIDLFLDHIQGQYSNPTILFVGNGTTLYEQKIKAIFADRTIINEPIQQYPTMHQLVEYAWHNWQQNKTLKTAQPLYLKQANYHVSIKP